MVEHPSADGGAIVAGLVLAAPAHGRVEPARPVLEPGTHAGGRSTHRVQFAGHETSIRRVRVVATDDEVVRARPEDVAELDFVVADDKISEAVQRAIGAPAARADM